MMHIVLHNCATFSASEKQLYAQSGFVELQQLWTCFELSKVRQSCGLRTSISECRVNEPGGNVLLGISTGSASPGQIHTKPSLSTVGRCDTLIPWHCTVLGILVHSPWELNVQPWYGHCT
jgi:hypothetical protein